MIQFSGADGRALLDQVRALGDAIERCIVDGGPSEDELRSAPILNQWAPVADVCPVLRGDLATEPGHVTREILVFAPEAGWARTLTGLYQLGASAENTASGH